MPILLCNLDHPASDRRLLKPTSDVGWVNKFGGIVPDNRMRRYLMRGGWCRSFTTAPSGWHRSTIGSDWGLAGSTPGTRRHRGDSGVFEGHLVPTLARGATVCRSYGTKINYPERKADFILGCFEYVTRLGGPEAAKSKLLAQSGKEDMIAFLKSFPGIGPKYARNVMMDVYHEDFRDSVALDVRINAISTALGLSFASYAEHEQFYLDLARDAGISGWELDRLLFHFRPAVESQLSVSMDRTGGTYGCDLLIHRGCDQLMLSWM